MKVTNIDNHDVIISERIAKVFSGACSQGNLCPVKDILSRYGDKWSMYTVLLLGKDGNMRFNEVKNGINGISQRMLTVTLRTLEEDGLIQRTYYPQIPPKVEYGLTELGRGLLAQLLELANWADSNFGEIMKARRRYIKKSS
jgi:DNA-binding HxlR family transcriptional regulator